MARDIRSNHTWPINVPLIAALGLRSSRIPQVSTAQTLAVRSKACGNVTTEGGVRAQHRTLCSKNSRNQLSGWETELLQLAFQYRTFSMRYWNVQKTVLPQPLEVPQNWRVAVLKDTDRFAQVTWYCSTSFHLLRESWVSVLHHTLVTVEAQRCDHKFSQHHKQVICQQYQITHFNTSLCTAHFVIKLETHKYDHDSKNKKIKTP